MQRFPVESSARLFTTLKYLHRLNVKIISQSDQKSLLTTPLISEITSTLSHLTAEQKIIAYTDGSTSPHGKSPNSGSGIFITNSNHKEIWSGGLIVRSDGNNFIAEMAAAAIITKACPPQLELVLRIDSMATIGAITKGLVSERKRIRAAGRVDEYVSFGLSAETRKNYGGTYFIT